jgi:rfaE bifunctional protein kinase chain/domain
MITESKIIKLKDCSSNGLRNLVLCHGHFNIIHPGHIRYLKHAKEMGASLAVSIVGNKEFKKSNRDHHFDEVERAEGVASIKFVDRVVLLENECLKSAIKILKPKVLVLGKEFEFQNFELIRESAEMVVRMGGKIHFHAGDTNYASTQYLLKSKSQLESESLDAFRKTTHLLGIKPDHIRETLENFSNASILVIGDSIIDQYVACDALGMSAEAPVVVARELESKRYLGGAGIVSIHAKRLGANCRFLSVVGDDELKDFVSGELQRQGVANQLVIDSTRPTTLKTRYTIENQKMFRVSKLREHPISSQIEEELTEKIRDCAQGVNTIMISDFVYGVITPKILASILELSREMNLKLIGDLQCSSQIGNVSKFKNFNLITPTEREARIALGMQEEGVEWVANKLIEQTCSEKLVLKLGAEGFISYSAENQDSIQRHYFPAISSNPLDVAGAGDALLSTLACGLSSNSPWMTTCTLGAIVASLSVQRLGNIPIHKEEVLDFIEKIFSKNEE